MVFWRRVEAQGRHDQRPDALGPDAGGRVVDRVERGYPLTTTMPRSWRPTCSRRRPSSRPTSRFRWCSRWRRMTDLSTATRSLPSSRRARSRARLLRRRGALAAAAVTRRPAGCRPPGPPAGGPSWSAPPGGAPAPAAGRARVVADRHQEVDQRAGPGPADGEEVEPVHPLEEDEAEVAEEVVEAGAAAVDVGAGGQPTRGSNHSPAWRPKTRQRLTTSLTTAQPTRASGVAGSPEKGARPGGASERAERSSRSRRERIQSGKAGGPAGAAAGAGGGEADGSASRTSMAATAAATTLWRLNQSSSKTSPESSACWARRRREERSAASESTSAVGLAAPGRQRRGRHRLRPRPPRRRPGPPGSRAARGRGPRPGTPPRRPRPPWRSGPWRRRRGSRRGARPPARRRARRAAPPGAGRRGPGWSPRGRGTRGRPARRRVRPGRPRRRGRPARPGRPGGRPARGRRPPPPRPRPRPGRGRPRGRSGRGACARRRLLGGQGPERGPDLGKVGVQAQPDVVGDREDVGPEGALGERLLEEELGEEALPALGAHDDGGQGAEGGLVEGAERVREHGDRRRVGADAPRAGTEPSAAAALA